LFGFKRNDHGQSPKCLPGIVPAANAVLFRGMSSEMVDAFPKHACLQFAAAAASMPWAQWHEWQHGRQTCCYACLCESAAAAAAAAASIRFRGVTFEMVDTYSKQAYNEAAAAIVLLLQGHEWRNG
jgi:hypothetical protein